MFFFVKFLFLFLSLIELTNLLILFDKQNYFLSNSFLSIFLFFFIFNFYFNQSITYNLNFDLVFKYFSLFLKNFSFLLNYFINTFKKIILFLYYFKYRHIKLSISVYFKKHLSSFFIFWKPLFKKTSYFGYFRSNRSKWIK